MISNSKEQIKSISSGKLPLRILLWKDISKQIINNPFFGYGFNSYKSINPIYQSLEVRELEAEYYKMHTIILHH